MFDENIPVVSMISRLASHKGFDLVKFILPEMLECGIQFVLLGTGEYELEEYFEAMQMRYPDKVKVFLEFNKDLSKKIYAGSDIFLMPSKSEPCGLSQMISSRYGTVPVVRETGGLYDTIKPYNKYTGEGNGFTFANYNAHEMKDALCRAIELFHDKRKWKSMCKKIMEIDEKIKLLEKGAELNAVGVVTAINEGSWKSWGNNTAAYPGTTDPKDRWICCRRFFSWWGNSFITTYSDKVDDPTNTRLIESIVDSENVRGNALVSQGKCAGIKMEYRQDDNPKANLLNGKIVFRQYLAPYTPAEDILNILEYDPSMIETELGGNQ